MKSNLGKMKTISLVLLTAAIFALGIWLGIRDVKQFYGVDPVKEAAGLELSNATNPPDNPGQSEVEW